MSSYEVRVTTTDLPARVIQVDGVESHEAAIGAAEETLLNSSCPSVDGSGQVWTVDDVRRGVFSSVLIED